MNAPRNDGDGIECRWKYERTACSRCAKSGKKKKKNLSEIRKGKRKKKMEKEGLGIEHGGDDGGKE